MMGASPAHAKAARAGYLDSLSHHGALFSPTLSRLALRGIKLRAPESIPIHVVRNAPVEYVFGTVGPFLGVSGATAVVSYSAYDDTLTALAPGDASLIVVWLDYDRYSSRHDPSFPAWLVGRLAHLRKSTSAPMLVVGSDLDEPGRASLNARLEQLTDHIPGLTVVDPGVTHSVARSSAVTQSRLSGERALELSRLLGAQWIPALLQRTVRMVVVDLDNTLYGGTLGEDGLDGIVVSPDHRMVLGQLAELARRGVLLAIASKNDPRDVDDLLLSGALSPLRPDDFVSVLASWQPKPDALLELLRLTRLGASATLFVDDNPGELLAASMALPDLHLVHAISAVHTAGALSWYPGLWRPSVSKEDLGRSADLRANLARASATSSDPAQYLAELEAEVQIDTSPTVAVRRISELSNKTNQFNTNLRRLTETDVARRLSDPDAFVVTVSLADRLSDSGLIALVSGDLQDETIVVDEVAVSCRALGRGVEDFFLQLSFDLMIERFKADGVLILSTQGPRNEPAHAWLRRNATPSGLGWRWSRRPELDALRSSITVTVDSDSDGEMGVARGEC